VKKEEWDRLVSGMSQDVLRMNAETIRSLEGRSAPAGRPAGGTSDTRQGALSILFERFWLEAGGSPLEKEFRFAPPRKWRADYVHMPSMTIIEIEGGVWTGGRHTRAQGFINDARKYNAARLLGFSVFRLPTGFTFHDVEQIVGFTKERGEHGNTG
jgi:hypothetical protein